MSKPAHPWEPGRDPVHRLVQCLDALAIAFNRFRQVSFTLPRQQDRTPVDAEGATAYSAGVGHLRADFEAVRDIVYEPGSWPAPGHFAQRLSDEAVAAFARLGVRDEATQRAVGEAAQWASYVLTPWVVSPVPRPWDYYSTPRAPDARPGRGERFQQEGALLLQYLQTRTALLSALSAAGETVPPDIDRRRRLASDTWQQREPITRDDLLALARAIHSTAAESSGAAPTVVGMKIGEHEKPAGTPFVPLTSWRDILAALNESPTGTATWKNNEPTRNKIRNLNTIHNGPIKLPVGRGKQPSVDKAALLAWWNGLRDQFDARVDEAAAAAKSAQHTVADTHSYGADGTVVPGVGGAVKRTRAGTGKNGKEPKG